MGLNHHLEHKRSVVCTFLRRAETVVANPSEKEEVKHVKNALTANGYKKKAEDPSKDSATARKFPVSIPYILGISEQLQRVLGSDPIEFPHTTNISTLLVSLKDKTRKEKQCGWCPV